MGYISAADASSPPATSSTRSNACSGPHCTRRAPSSSRASAGATTSSPAESARVVADPRYQPLLLERTTLRTQYLGLNCAMPPFDQAGVRQAFNMAVDKPRLLELIDGRGVVATTILPSDMPGYDASTPGYAFDPRAARARLEAAGLGQGFATTLWASRDEGSMRLAQSIQQDLRAIGVELALKPVDFPALIEAVRHPGMVPLFLPRWEADFPDPSNFLIVLL